MPQVEGEGSGDPLQVLDATIQGPVIASTTDVAKKEPVVALVELHEETEDSEYDEEEEPDLESIQGDPEKESTAANQMPLFGYRRPNGSLPRSSINGSASRLASNCSASALGSVWITASTTLPEGSTDVTNTNNSSDAVPTLTRTWFNTKVDLVAYGFVTSSVLVVDAASSTSIGDFPSVRSDNAKHAIVALCWDATGTQLGVLDQGGMVAVFADLKYSVQLSARPSASVPETLPATPEIGTGAPPPVTATQAARPNAFSSFFSAFTGRSGPTPAEAPSGAATANVSTGTAPLPAGTSIALPSEAATQPPSRVPTLALAQPSSQQQVHRISYPKSFGRPTCLALDPAYQKRQHVLVGFADGRLVWTKRGFFQRRQDVVVYQASGSEIQAVVWRGSLVAWADDSGIRLWDVETQARIAHIDRPSGARPSLYPSVSGVVPSLCWESSSALLVGWGDCLMQLRVNDYHSGSPRGQLTDNSTLAFSSAAPQQDTEETGNIVNSGSEGTSSPSPELEQANAVSAPSTRRRRVVECSMAWQLDGIACGVAPLDQDHVVALVLVPPVVDEELDSSELPPSDLEMQVIARVNGEVLHADLLPILRAPVPPIASAVTGRASPRQQTTALDAREVASSFRLLSSFAAPRMDDVSEALAMGGSLGEGGDMPTPVSLFSGSHDTRRSFQDPHLRWSLKMVSFENDEYRREYALWKQEARDSESDSVDSDDYDIVLHAPTPKEQLNDHMAIPPAMVVVGSSDVVSVRLRNVDDAVSFALAENRAGLALFRGLCYRRQLREHTLNDLVNAWFRAILRLQPTPSADDDNKNTKVQADAKSMPHLSLRRMKLAAEALPILLGGDVAMWCHWIAQMERIPGALFIARYSLPVRDPVLPATVYANVLGSMLHQIEDMSYSKTDVTTVDRLSLEAEGHFLNTLLAWGPLQSLKECIRLYQEQCQHDATFIGAVRTLEESLARRYEQSSACYLQFSNTQASSHQPSSELHAVRSPYEASLYNIREALDLVLKRVSVGSRSLVGSEGSGEAKRHSRVAFDAAAKLSIMQGKYDTGLRYYLLIGTHDTATQWFDIEESALQTVNQVAQAESKRKRGRHTTYAYILSLIEMHNLHQCLLDDHFLSPDDDAPPILALARLVGLEHLGDFLIRHCIAPQRSQDRSEGQTPLPEEASPEEVIVERRGTLPLDLVAQQLEGSPKLLHWFLHLVFVQKPSVYVVFPHTANPPSIIAFLHRKHLDLYLKFAGPQRDSAEVFQGVEAYRVPETVTRLLSFLKAVLQLGAMQPMDVAKLLQIERRGSAGVSRVFALELAYILEHFGDESEEEAQLILNLYLKGCSNLMLAVSYAQRATAHSAVLWEALIDYCLSEPNVADLNAASGGSATTARALGGRFSGSLFGSLLEAAALSGADLAHLVKTIPPGMPVEGLRPRLVAAVADSRLKVQMRQTALDVAARERADLQREMEHRSRRGARGSGSGAASWLPPGGADPAPPLAAAPSKLVPGRAQLRLERVRLPLSIPIR